MPVRMTLLLIALAALAAPSAASAPSSSTGRIAFATDRGPNLRRIAIYSVEFASGSRRRVATPEPPAQWLTRSPNGRLIAYSRSEGTSSFLFVSRPSGEGAVRIGPFAVPVFSKDGSKLAVTRSVSCGPGCYQAELDVVRGDGTGLHRVAEDATGASWSPDGQRLVYRDGRGNIRVVGVNGLGDHYIGFGYLPQWAPRGNRVVFVATRGGYGVACFVNADGSGRACAHGFSAKSILWAPDGRSVAFRHSRSGKLGIIDAHARRLRLLSPGGDRLIPVAWSPDATRLAFLAGTERTQVFAYDLRRRIPLRQVTNEPKLTYISNVQWRNGRISYAARLDTNDLEIAVMNGDGTGAHTLTHNTVQEQDPAWSPDGDELVFSRTQGPTAGLQLMNADGSDQRMLVHSDTRLDMNPAWSPDGTTVAFVESPSLFGFGELWVVGRDGSGRRKLSSALPHPTGISWSPDGRSVVVAGKSGLNGFDLFVVDVQADVSRRLGLGLPYVAAPTWSPDGSRIMFAGTCPAPPCQRLSLYEVRPDGSGLKKVVDSVTYPRSAWTTDGRILFSREFVAGGMTSQAIAAASTDGTGELPLTRSLSVNIDPAWSD
jgi:Tol biopolymer transport system component